MVNRYGDSNASNSRLQCATFDNGQIIQTGNRCDDTSDKMNMRDIDGTFQQQIHILLKCIQNLS